MFSFANYLTLLFFSILLGSVACGQRGPAPALPPYKLSEMKVVPYSHRTNTLLAEIPENRTGELWNELNLSLFVTVQVSGKAGSYSSNRSVEVTAYEANKLILKRIARIGVIDEESGRYYIPVWLYGPFCRPVRIKARLLGQREPSTLSRTIPFQCGE